MGLNILNPGYQTSTTQETEQNAALGNATSSNPAVARTDQTVDVSVKSVAVQTLVQGVSVAQMAGIAAALGLAVANPPVLNDDSRLLTADERAANLTANVTGTPSGSNPVVVESNPALPIFYDDVAAAEAATGVADGRLVWVTDGSILTMYEKVDAGSAYTRDGLTVLNTGEGGNTRFVGRWGKYAYGSTSHLRIAADLLGVEWAAVKSRGDGVAGADNEVLLNIPMCGYNDAVTPEKIEFAKIYASIIDASDGTESGLLSLAVMANGTLTEAMRCHKGVVGIGVTDPSAAAKRLYAYDNTTGATNPLAYFHQDHASNTGVLVKLLHDGTGTPLFIDSTNASFTGNSLYIGRQNPSGAVVYSYVNHDSAAAMEWNFSRRRAGSPGGDGNGLLNLRILGYNNAGSPELIEYARIATSIASASDGAEGGGLSLQVSISGVLTEGFYCGSNGWGLKGATSKTLSTGWSVANLTSDKVLDCDANDDLATADVLGTLITELIAKGVISG